MTAKQFSFWFFFSIISHPLSVCIMLYINLSLSCIMFCMVSCSYEYPFLLLWTDIFIYYILHSINCHILMINPSRYWIHDSLHFVDRVFYCEFLPITIFSVHSLKGKFQGCDILLRQYWNYFCCFGVYMCTYFWKEDPMFRFVVCFVNVCVSLWHKILLLAIHLSIDVKS